jgi:hypothetical protein
LRHTYCNTEPRFLRSHPKDRPIQSPLKTRMGMRRTYSNPGPHGVPNVMNIWTTSYPNVMNIVNTLMYRQIVSLIAPRGAVVRAEGGGAKI